MANTNQFTVTCPSCDETIDITENMKHQVEKQLKQEMKIKLEEKEENLNAQHQKQLKDLKAKYQEDAEKQSAEKLKSMQEELAEKSSKLKDMTKKEAELLKLKRQHESLKEDLELDFEKKLNSKLDEEKQKLQERYSNESELKIKELEKKLQDQVEMTKLMKKKQEQGSMQMQGEVLELALEEFLVQTFPLDRIEEIKKGQTGADCIQIVNTRNRQNCGSIYYETKRTKHFNENWIEKFKADIREQNATIGVLVSEVLPDDIKSIGERDGVWICDFKSLKMIAQVLRKGIVDINFAESKNQNKADKMELLYNFLTSNEFKLQVEAIVEGFTQMSTDLESEKRAMKRLWKKREKQLEKVIDSTLAMHGSIKGIAGNAIQNIQALELGANAIGEEVE
jgi:hypothetical protein